MGASPRGALPPSNGRGPHRCRGAAFLRPVHDRSGARDVACLPPPTINGLTSRFRYHAEMVDDDLARVIAQALADARQKGLDNIGQTDHAIRAVLAARPDMTASDAMWQVERLQRG